MAYSGTYRGITFRSLLELSVIRHLEDEGLVLGSTMLYEATRVPYGKTRIRTYIVDLTLPQTKTLVEVKPSSRAENRNNTAKRRGAEAWCAANGWTYVIVTEEELSACGKILLLEEAAKIPEVKLNERALRALRRKERRKMRKRK
jgi:RES domain-containing protein